MTPYRKPSTPKQLAFNKAHRKTRVKIEQVFGIWKRRFHLLHTEVKMHPEKVCKLVGACAILHNIAIAFNEPVMAENTDDNAQQIPEYQGQESGQHIRDQIANMITQIMQPSDTL